jgi:hypothetical protein
MADGQRYNLAAPDDYLYELLGAPSPPPYRFSGVSMRVFPLRASLRRLRQFCDSYLNVFRGVAEFRPLDGFVELVVLEYPSITSVEQPAFATYGQTEVFFLIPVLWTDVISGDTRVAVITPYIFVDNPTSARLGRDLFGWPKEAAWYRRDAIASGFAAHHLAIDKETLANGGVTTSRLLEVDSLGAQERLSFGRPSAGSTISFDLNGLIKLAARPVRAAGRGLALWHRYLRGALTQWRTPTDVLNINLKQAPQLEPVGTACYQALTVTPLRATRLNGFGLLGERRQLLGDPSGGCIVRIYEDPTWPVVTQLGLSFEDASLDGSEPRNRVAYEFKPVFPFWLSTDFEQQPSRIIASRGTPALGVGAARTPMVSVLGSRSLLGTTSGMSFLGARVQMFELSADPTAQQRLVDELNALQMDFVFALPAEVDGSVSARVLVSVATIEGMRSERISLLDWHETLVELYVPLNYRRRNVAIERAERAMFAHSGFATSSTLSNTIHEALGGNVMLATLDRGELAGAGLGVDNPLQVFRLSTTVVPHFQLGETARIAPVLEVLGRPRTAGATEPTSTAFSMPGVPLLRLKQLPSAENPRKASYQALIKSMWKGAHGMRVDAGLDHELYLFDYESLRLVNRLGLRAPEGETVAAGRGERGTRRRPLSEALYVLHGEVTLDSEVLWERLSQ